VKAYALVYRHLVPSQKDLHHTQEAAELNPLLSRYLAAYESPDSVYDWGDDPSFFAATEVRRSPNRATWGVCRPDVRRSLHPGDFVTFFCARQLEHRRWDYFYIGVGTVDRLLDRSVIWDDDEYKSYREFFNVLAHPDGGELRQHESIHRFHADWEKRASAPYITFDPEKTRFNLRNPVYVASFDRANGGIEVWHHEDPRVLRLSELILPAQPTKRGLRSTNIQIAHPPMNLEAQAQRVGGFDALREQLLVLVDE
jgi:hypothetical protein